MEIVDHCFDERLSVLALLEARANVVTEFAFDRRMNRFRLPALAKKAIQASLGDQVSTGFALGGDQTTSASNRRDQITFGHRLTIKTRIGQKESISTLRIILRAVPQGRQHVGIIWANPPSGLRHQNHLALGSNCIRTLQPAAKRLPPTGAVVSTGRTQGIASRITGNDLFFDVKIVQHTGQQFFRRISVKR